MPTSSRNWLNGGAAFLTALSVMAALSINVFVLPAKGLTTPEAFFNPGPLLPAWAEVGTLYGLIYLFLGILSVPLTFALYERLTADPTLARMSLAFGLISATLFAASGGLYYATAFAINQAAPINPTAAVAILHSLTGAATGLSIPADLIFSVWIILSCGLAWREQTLPGGLCVLGMVIGAANGLGQLLLSTPLGMGLAILAFFLSPIWAFWLAFEFFRHKN